MGAVRPSKQNEYCRRMPTHPSQLTLHTSGHRLGGFVSLCAALIVLAPPLCASLQTSHAFSCSPQAYHPTVRRRPGDKRIGRPQYVSSRTKPLVILDAQADDDDMEALEEEARLKVLQTRRKIIRSNLKSAESLRNFRIKNGFVPELDDEGNPIKSDSKAALTLTAFFVAAGAVALRVGGRAALVSSLGLDFVTENPSIKENMDSVLNYAGSLDPVTEGALFIAAWTAVKVLCFDAGGVALALSSGILFGGVLQGALFSAFAATVGSSVAFGLAKMDTPVRKKALEIVDEYPSLRGIEKVVARDGLKAILTLRLAPVLPIPIGMYNYVYGVTNVPFLDFVGGVFLGSLKPYLLDSYLGYYGKSIVDGSAAKGQAGTEDVILLVVLGVSVLIGVFASQLAGETWESVTKEVEAEERAKKGDDTEKDDGIVRSLMGMDLPQWLVGFQLALSAADDRINDFIEVEYRAKVWNYTKEEGIPRELDPAFYPDSPEISEKGKGFDFGRSICEGMVLSPSLLKAYWKYSDPLYYGGNESNAIQTKTGVPDVATSVDFSLDTRSGNVGNRDSVGAAPRTTDAHDLSDEELLALIDCLRIATQERLSEVEDSMKDLSDKL